MKTMALILHLFFILPRLALGGVEMDSVKRQFDGPLMDNFEVDIFGMKIFGGRDAVADVLSLQDGFVELHVTSGSSKWTTKCMVDDITGGKDYLKQGESYTVKTTATDINCKSLDVKAAPYVDMSPFFTPTTEKYTIDGHVTKCCCVGGRTENVCQVVPLQGYLAKVVQLWKKELFQFWNPLSSTHFFAFEKLLFKRKNGCGMLAGKGYHSHMRGDGSRTWTFGRSQLLPNTKCRAKRSVFTLPFTKDFSEDKDGAAMGKKAEEYISQVVKEQPAPWYTKELQYADRKSWQKTISSWMENLKPDSNDQKRIDAAREFAVDQQVMDNSGALLEGAGDPEALPEDRFPLQFQVRYITTGEEKNVEEGQEEL
jgi:hypothetical protein